MRLTPNLNGTAPMELIAQRRRIMEAITELRKALGAAWPHGRDYQLSPDRHAREDDSFEWEQFVSVLEAWEQRMITEAREIQGV